MLKAFLNLADRCAIALSTLCVVHCLLLPIILLALPTLTSVAFFSDERFHSWLLFAVIPISFLAIVMGYVHHRSGLIVAITSVGMMILILVALFGHQILGERGEVVASVVGSLCVAYGHLRNFRLRKFKSRCHPTSI